MTRRRWIADEWNEDTAILLDAHAAHLTLVLRARVGQEFDIIAGGSVRRGVVEDIRKDRVRFTLHEEVKPQGALPLTIGLSIIRFERMEWAIEKLTELGVARIVPLRAERSEKHLAQAAEKRVERWSKIARESAQQSRRGDVPEISSLTALSDWVAEGPGMPRLLLSERERERPLRDWLEARDLNAWASIYAAIGPEGGWTAKELASFAAHGWHSVSLGARILRAETAAVAIASVVNIWLAA